MTVIYFCQVDGEKAESWNTLASAKSMFEGRLIRKRFSIVNNFCKSREECRG